MSRPSPRAVPHQSISIFGIRIFALRPVIAVMGSDYAEQFLPDLRRAA